MATPFEKSVEHYQAGRLDLAEGVLRRALAGPGGDPQLASLMAMVLSLQGRLDQAEHYYKRALLGRAHSPALRTNYGNMLLLAGRLPEARAQLEEAVRLDPSFCEAHVGLAPVLHQLGDGEGAIAAARRAVEIAPLDCSARLNLGSALVAMGYVDESMAVVERGLEIEPGNIKLITNYLMSMHYRWGCTAEHLLSEHRRLGARFARAAGAAAQGDRALPNRDRSRPLRVGYLSSDLRAHVVATFLRPLLVHRDRTRIHFTAYHVGMRDQTTAELEPHFDQWRWAASMDDRTLEQRIREDRIDVLVDLNGHTDGSRIAIMTRRVARAQATFIGYPDTTGVPGVDFRLVDALTDPPGLPGGDFATEKLWRLGRCFLCYAPTSEGPEDVGPSPFRRQGWVTFASFNAAPKINDETLRLWGRVLAGTPGSRLLLKNRALSSPKRQEEVLGQLTKAGIDPGRIELIGWRQNAEQHLAEYGRVDIALDSLPYNGTTTTCEALWMGAPVVTLAGGPHVGRVGVSLLTAVGLPELIARDEDDYVRISTDLAADGPRLESIRAGLRRGMRASALCDAPGYTRAVETALEEMWSERVAANG